MAPIIVLGVAGVLQPVESLWLAEIRAACEALAERGVAVDRFRAAALDRVRQGRAPALVQTARAAGLALSREDGCRLVLEARRAIPAAPDELPREALRALRAGHRLAVLDQGAGSRMDTWLARLGVADLAERCVWTDDLGEQARPPRPLAFRWLASRLGAAPDDCLYVAGRADLRRAALAAGWRTWDSAASDPSRAADLWTLVADLEAAAEPQRVAE